MSSIHFILMDGAVRIVGTVPSVAERQRIETIVTQIPGVVRVYDALAVNASVGAEGGGANTTALPPTSFGATNTGVGVPTPPATNRIYEPPK
jgi:hypothetical protein